MAKPMTIFLSSTREELIRYRNSTRDVVLGFGAVFRGMEHFGASYHPPLETCLNTLEKADLVIVILGTWYGSCPPGQSKSFTELEIEHALFKKIPMLVYIMGKDVLVDQRWFAPDDARAKLTKLKLKLTENNTVGWFNSPEDLGRQIACDLHTHYATEPHKVSAEAITPIYRECAYDHLANWYDYWYQGHWDSNKPFNTICALVGAYPDFEQGNIHGKRILDVACGTGNAYVAFTRAKFNIWGTDGSHEMLKKAESNCQSIGIPTKRLVLEPINWTDRSRYLEEFSAGSFDLIINTANSFCHIPPTAEYMQTALNNFYELLRPGGLLLIDTKKYIRNDPIGCAPTLKELKYDDKSGEWLERVDRHEKQEVPGRGEVHFHTRLMYDSDPAFTPAVRRALIIITIYGSQLVPRTLVVPYYPLPAMLLKDQMNKVGYLTKVHHAKQGLNVDWKYDVVIGQKPK